MLAETLAMIGRLWGALYRHIGTRWHACLGAQLCHLVCVQAPQNHMEQNKLRIMQKFFFDSFIGHISGHV